MFADIENVLVIDYMQALLAAIHQCFFTDTVDLPWYAGRNTEDFVQCPPAEQFPVRYPCVGQVGLDVFFGFRPVQMGQNTVNVNPLSDCIVAFEAELVIPQLRLTHKDKCHRTLGVKMIVQKETEFLYCFLLQKMGFIQHTYHTLPMDAADDLDFLLQLAFGIPAVKLCLKSQLIQKSFVKPPGCQLGVGQIQEDIFFLWQAGGKLADQG